MESLKVTRAVEQRPWGKFEILTQFNVQPEGEVCVKIITVSPKKRLSYQSHTLRSEQWVFVQGHGTVVLDEKSHVVVAGSCVNIPVNAKHRIGNDSDNQNLVFVEVSSGHFDENDIKRFEDDFGRA